MPSPELMTWIPERRQWTKRYMGRRYYVSCRQLGIKPETKEASLHAANQWWRDKQAELDLAERVSREQSARIPQPLEDLLASLLGSKGTWTSKEDIAKAATAFLDKMPPSNAAETLAEEINYAAYCEAEHGDDKAWDTLAQTLGRWLLPKLLERAIIDGKPLPDTLKESLPPARAAQLERGVKELRGEQAADPDRTVKALSEKWLHAQQVQVSIGGLTATRYDGMRHSIAHFTAFLGETADISTVNAESLEGFHNFCLSKIAERREDETAGWSAYHAKIVFATARQWMRWLVERDTISKPANFDRKWRFGSTVKQIKTWTVEEVQTVVNAAAGKLKLCLLLMLNCGMSQKDASDLRDVEVNWRDGRVIRKRSKTRLLESVPVVNYKLWPSTFALLKEHRSGKERVLLTVSGKPYVNRRVVDGKFRAVDGFGTLLRKVTNKCGVKKPLKLIRKTAASLLESHTAKLPTGELVNPYAGCVSLFLGHSPRTMKDNHYAAPPQELFDAAVTWLGRKLEIAE